MDQPINAPLMTERATTNRESTRLVLVTITSIVALIVGGSIGYAIGYSIASRNHNSDMSNGGSAFNGQNGGGLFGGDPSGRMDSLGNRLTGGVSAVNGSSFTVIGDGGTYTITTNSDTKWSGQNSSVAINDTVMISYTGSGDTLTATCVRVSHTLPVSSGSSTNGSAKSNASSSSDSSPDTNNT